ncbi:MAG: hypothetical protein LBH20_10600 [Treponema sp.]|jgi:O-glycosyl hydrolase|nr:hypothetical protein [Treponema sp.]
MANKKLFVTAIGILLSAMLVFSGCTQLSNAEAPPKNIVRPYISVQPRSASYYTNAAPATIELKIQIWDWKQADEGTLSCQWYTFNTIEEYCTSGGGAAIDGASDISYDDADGTTTSIYNLPFTATAGTKYYYVVVTNKNPNAGDSKQATVQSEVAVISFSDPGDPLLPIVVRNPVSAKYGWGAMLNTLKVEARLAAGSVGSLSYRWYTNSSFSTTGGTAIADENLYFLMPDYDDLDLDNNYYYVEVINEEGGKQAVAKTIPANIFMEPGVKAVAPVITLQPQDRLYFTGETFDSLSVTGESPDRGTISYQWYSNTTPASRGGAAISGATGATYRPTVSNTTVQNYFYYAVVTNTNNKVKGAKTATTASKVIQVSVASPAGDEVATNLFMSIPDKSGTHLTATGVVESNTFQYIRGYGGMDVGWGNFPRTTRADTELMYDPDRLGYNMLRIMIRADYVDPTQTIAELVAGDRPDYYENVKIVNKYGGYVEASPWTPPKEWKSNNSINGGGNLIPRYYSLYANYLRTFAQNMYDNGAPIYCISISNEPNYVAGYDGCEWEPDEMRDFFLEVGHFTDGIRGYGGGKETPYVQIVNGESANTPNINLSALANPQSKAAIDILARHVYGSRTVSLWNDNKAAITRPDGTLMEVWMTEHNINSANATGYYNDSSWNYVWRFLNDVDLVMRMNNENAFIWWASKRFYSMVGDGQFGTTDGSPLPRGWGLAHYARFTVGMTRIHINADTSPGKSVARDGTAITHTGRSSSRLNNVIDDMDNDAIRITAYISADGNEISVIMWSPTKPNGTGGIDPGVVRVDLPPGFSANGVTAVRSNGGRANELFQPYNIQLNQARTVAYVTLGKSEIISVKFTK